MTASQNILLELKKLGIELDMSPNKLKNGFGEGVCVVLISLCQISVQNKVKFKKANIGEDARGFADDGEDEFGGDEFEGNADIADMNHKAKGKDGESDNDDIDEDLDFGVGQVVKNDEHEQLQQQIMHSSIARDEWMLEVERVAHRLKINKS